MLKPVLLTLLLAVPLLAHAADPVEGVDYTVITQPAEVEVPGKIEVREFFWYGCPHCYRLNPFINSWLASKPADVNFIRTPAAIGETWTADARGFYIAQQYGVDEKSVNAVFEALHSEPLRMSTMAGMSGFYADFGIKPEDFAKAYRSDAIAAKIQHSRDLFAQFKLDGVPSIIVDGKYKVGGETQKAIDTVNFLIAKERQEQATGTASPAAASGH